MTAQQLKNSILQMAVQGKLVPQDPNDEPASVLLERIKAEKQELIKQGKIKKEKPLAPITEDEIPFDIPDSWEWVRLKTICTKLVDGDHNPPKGELQETKYFMISSTNINNDRIESLDKVRYLSKETFEIENQRTQATKGDIFFTSVGSLGRSCVYLGEYNLAFQRSVSIISTLVFNYYLKFCFDSGYFQYKIQKEATGTAQKGFYLNQLSECLIPIPPIDEQHRIVAKIEEILPYIDKYGTAETKLSELNASFPEALKKSILQEAVQGKLIPQDPNDEPASVLLERIRAEKQALIKAGKIKKEKHESVIVTRDKIPYEIIDGEERCIADEVPFELPESWCWCRLGSISKNIQYGTSQKSSKEGKMPVLRMGNLQDGRIIYDKLVYSSDDDEISRYPLLYNDLLFNRTNSREIVGKTAIYKAEMPAIYAGYLVRITPMIDSDYLNYVMQSQYYWIYCQTVRSDAIGQSNINAEKLKHFLVPVPPIEEQHRIVAKIEEIMPMIERLILR